VNIRQNAVIGVLASVTILTTVSATPCLSGEVSSRSAQTESEDIQHKLDKALAQNTDLEQIIAQLNKKLDLNNSPLQQKYYETLSAQYDYDVALMKQHQSVLTWELFASNVSLWLVAFIVVAGVGFAGVQLWQAVQKGGPQAETQLEIAATKFRLTSSVVGIVVLGMSYFFFYLFVKEIYPLTPLNVDASHVETSRHSTPDQ
jgi:hypothetical protein